MDPAGGPCLIPPPYVTRAATVAFLGEADRGNIGRTRSRETRENRAFLADPLTGQVTTEEGVILLLG